MKSQIFKSHIPKGDNKHKWSSASANITKNKSSLEIYGNPVMEDWERPYMKKLAETATLNGGKVLEVGFGLGIASSYIQQSNATEHQIIEANLEVYKDLLEFNFLTKTMLVTLAENNIKTLEEFAGLTTDELIGYYEDRHDKNSKVEGILEEYNLTKDEGDELIMEARKIWLK